MITAGLRRAILAAAGRDGAEDGDPLLRPGLAPGGYASSLPFRLARPGQDQREVAAALAGRLACEPWIATAEVGGRGFLTVTVTDDALAGLAVRIAQTGSACAQSDALRGHTVPAAPPGPLAPGRTGRRPGGPRRATDRPSRRRRGRHRLSLSRTVLGSRPAPPPPAGPAGPSAPPPITRPIAQPIARPIARPIALPGDGPVAAAARYAGADTVRFALARMPPGGEPPDAAVIARHVLANPAYAVRYAHAAAAAVLRWAAALGTRPAGFTPRLLAEPGELALLDALSWLPERVAMAARRGRPDEFAGYLEELAARTIETMSTTSFTTVSSISSERRWLADAARTGLAAGLGLLGIGAPSRL